MNPLLFVLLSIVAEAMALKDPVYMALSGKDATSSRYASILNIVFQNTSQHAVSFARDESYYDREHTRLKALSPVDAPSADQIKSKYAFQKRDSQSADDPFNYQKVSSLMDYPDKQAWNEAKDTFYDLSSENYSNSPNEQEKSLLALLDETPLALNRSLAECVLGNMDLERFTAVKHSVRRIAESLHSTELVPSVARKARQFVTNSAPHITQLNKLAAWICFDNDDLSEKCLPYSFDAYSTEVKSLCHEAGEVLMDILFATSYSETSRSAVEVQKVRLQTVRSVDTTEWRTVPGMHILDQMIVDATQMVANSVTLLSTLEIENEAKNEGGRFGETGLQNRGERSHGAE